MENILELSEDRKTIIGVKDKNVALITIPKSVTTIGNYVFWGCKSLQSIDIPNSVTTIGDSAFYDCSSLKKNTIPNSVTNIGSGAFDSCYNITSVTCLATIPPALGESVFIPYIADFYVPAQSVNAYKTASGWSTYSSRITAIQ